MRQTLFSSNLEHWLGQKSPTHQYVELDSRHCLLAEYARRTSGRQARYRDGVIACGGEETRVPEEISRAIAAWPHTVGALLDRLRPVARAPARAPADLCRTQ